MMKQRSWHRLTRRRTALPSLFSTPLSHYCDASVSFAAPLCVALRAASSTAAPLPPAATLARTSTPHFSAGPKRRLRNPAELSHEELSYAACPVCGTMQHMTEMLVHITALHKGEDVAHWKAECDARVALYERVVGVPLVSPGSDPVLQSGRRQHATALAPESLQALAPTLTAGGAYMCNWCTIKTSPFATRDAFLLHVAKCHPTLDFDAVEAIVCGPPTAAASTAQDSVASASSWESIAAGSGWGALAAVQGPSRRLPGVKTVVEANPVAPVAVERQRHSLTISRVNPFAERKVGSVPTTTTAAHDDGDDARPFFGDRHFPCELCNKLFTSELNLLQHLEGKHAPPPLPSSTAAAVAAAPVGTEAAAAAAAAASTCPTTAEAAASPEKTANNSTSIRVKCDLCRNSAKVFTLPSALFAHIRFRHRAVDATYEAERMMQEQKGRLLYRCPYCVLMCPDSVSLQQHVWAAHKKRIEVKVLPGQDSYTTAAELDPLTGGVIAPSPLNACPTLPPFSIKERWWCNECERGFATSDSLSYHRAEKHESVAQLFPCPACRRVFRTGASLEAHVRQSHRGLQLADMGVEVSCVCPSCSRGFVNHDALHLHSVRHHGKDPKSPVRAFAAPAAKADARAAPRGSADEPAASSPHAVSPPPKPRKVSRAKKAVPADV